jgi:hypothetical protein
MFESDSINCNSSGSFTMTHDNANGPSSTQVHSRDDKSYLDTFHHAKRSKADLLENQRGTFRSCLRLFSFASKDSGGTFNLPPSLREFRLGNDLEKLRNLFDGRGFRTSVIVSPRTALSIYKDSCRINVGDGDVSKEFLLILFGMHPNQHAMERLYTSSIKRVYCLLLFGTRIREACRDAVERSDDLAKVLEETERACNESCTLPDPLSAHQRVLRLSSRVSEMTTKIMKLTVKADPRIRIEQLQRELDRITVQNSSLANAYLQLFVDYHDVVIKDIYFKEHSDTKFERIIIYLYDSEVDHVRPPRFTFLPVLHKALEMGARGVAKKMLDSFWMHLLRRGYYATEAIKADMSVDLERYFVSGITNDVSLPLLL